jgi:hypothetical protein
MTGPLATTTCLCAPEDYDRCADPTCPHAPASRPDNDDAEETGTCERCDAVVPLDDLIRHIDVSFCRACDAAWQRHFAACIHQWEPHQGEWGPGRYCTRCTGFVEDEDAMIFFPLICDGWVTDEGMV